MHDIFVHGNKFLKGNIQVCLSKGASAKFSGKKDDHIDALKSSAEKRQKNCIVYIPAIKIFRIFTKKDSVYVIM